MSQALSGRTIPLSSNTPIVSRLVWLRRTARLRLTRRVYLSLWLSLGLLCATAATTSAQQAQTVKSTQPIVCANKNYRLRLVSAEAPINNNNARALGIVLTPEDATDSKVFCLYWTNPKSTGPSHRDDTSGKPDTSLRNYGDGRVEGELAVASFFNEAKCLPEDAQVIGIEKLLDKNVGGAPANLRDLASALKNENVGVDEGQVEDASVGNLDLFKGLANNLGFAKAIRQYVSNLLAGEGRTGDQLGGKPTSEDEKNILLAQNKDLETHVKALLGEKNSFFGGAPRWLISAFLVTLSLSLAALAFVVWGLFHPAGRETPSGAQAASGQPEQISAKLGEMTVAAQNRRRSIEQTYTESAQTGPAQNQKAKGQDNLADTIVTQLVTRNILQKNNCPQARRVIDTALDAEKDTASRSRQHSDEWHRAYTELQNQLEELQKSLSHPDGPPPVPPPSMPTSPGTEQSPLVVQELKQRIDHLVTDIGAMKSSVDSFSGKLTTDVEARQGLQNIWWRWYGQDYSGGPTNALVKEVGEVIDLYRFLSERCRKQGASVTQTKESLECVLSDLEDIRKTHLSTRLGETVSLHEITNKVKSKLFEDAEAVREYKAIELLLRNLDRPDAKASQIVRQLIDDMLAAREKLGKYHPDRNFVKAIDAVVSNYEAITAEVNQVLPGAGSSAREVVASLATAYLDLKPVEERARQLEKERTDLQQQLTTAQTQLEAGKELVEEIALQLNFKTDHLKEYAQAITGALDKLKRERDASVYLQLRLGLSSALIALGKATNSNNFEGQQDVIEALHLDKVKKGIKDLLAEMEEYSGEQLWNRGIFMGFSQKWLHYLLRADLLLRTYYADRQEFGLLRKAVSLACSALLAALYEFQVEVVEVGLFAPLPRDMEQEPVYPGLRNLPAVRDKVRSEIQNIQTGDVVVDVTSFPYFVKGVQENRGCVALANPSAWLQH